jgi:nucleoid-associated protein YgaU
VAIAALATTALLLTVRPSLRPVPADGDDLAIAVAWTVAFACSLRLTLTSVWCAVALHRDRPERARRVARLAPVFVRRAVEVAIVSSIAVSVPVAASALPRDEPVVRAVVPAPFKPTPPAPTPAAPTPSVPPVVAAPRTYVVRRGDNLWSIARARLVTEGNADPDETHIARYWRALVAANQATLRSGNPSLIFPGEVIALPATEDLS